MPGYCCISKIYNIQYGLIENQVYSIKLNFHVIYNDEKSETITIIGYSKPNKKIIDQTIADISLELVVTPTLHIPIYKIIGFGKRVDVVEKLKQSVLNFMVCHNYKKRKKAIKNA